VVIYSNSTYERCQAVKDLFEEGKVKHTVVEVDWLPNQNRVIEELEKISGQRYLPNIFIGGEHYKGADRDLFRASKNGMLSRLLAKNGI
jgi:glutaredoxin 3